MTVQLNLLQVGCYQFCVFGDEPFSEMEASGSSQRKRELFSWSQNSLIFTVT